MDSNFKRFLSKKVYDKIIAKITPVRFIINYLSMSFLQIYIRLQCHLSQTNLNLERWKFSMQSKTQITLYELQVKIRNCFC